MTDGTFPDFPKLAISHDKVVQTGDAFTVSTSRFKGTEFAVLNKADVVAGVQTPGFEFFAPPQGLSALAAAEILPSSAVTTKVYLAAVPTGKMHLPFVFGNWTACRTRVAPAYPLRSPTTPR